MSTNEVMLFGVLAADAEIRGGGTSSVARWALLKVETYAFARHPQTKKPIVHVTEHEVHCFDELSIDPLLSIGKKGFWIRVRGNLTYADGRQAYIRVPVRGGQATVSAYFGNKIRPDHPIQMVMMEAAAEEDEPARVEQSPQPEPESAPAPRAVQQSAVPMLESARTSSSNLPRVARPPVVRPSIVAALPRRPSIIAAAENPRPRGSSEIPF